MCYLAARFAVKFCIAPCSAVLAFMLRHGVPFPSVLHYAKHFIILSQLCHGTLICADESDDEEEATARMPSSRISTSMVKQATAHLHRDGR